MEHILYQVSNNSQFMSGLQQMRKHPWIYIKCRIPISRLHLFAFANGLWQQFWKGFKDLAIVCTIIRGKMNGAYYRPWRYKKEQA